MTQRNLGKQVDPEAFTLKFEEGLNRKELAEHFQCAPQTVSIMRKRLGLPAFKGTPRWVTPERLAKLEVMLDDGMSFIEIHRTEGVSPLTLQRYFPGRAWSIEQANELRKAQRDTRNKISKLYGSDAADIRVAGAERSKYDLARPSKGWNDHDWGAKGSLN